jgi:putative transposase
MPHTYIANYTHIVFSTKNRADLIDAKIEDRLYGFLGGIARQHGMKALAIGGTANHVHILASIPGPLGVSKAVQLLKGGSSKWLHETFPELRKFAWQEAFGAFSVGVSQVPMTISYIKRQKEHHRKQSFDEEFIAFLKKHGIDYDPRFVFG